MLKVDGREGLPFGPPVDDPPEFAEIEITDAIYTEALGREIALPLRYMPRSPQVAAQTIGYKPGRVLLYTGSAQSIRPDIHEFVCPEDVITVYPNNEGVDYSETLAVLKDVGPQVYAVLVGQWNAEMGDIHHIADGTDATRERSVAEVAEFVKVRGRELREIGVRPAFGLTHFQTLIHAYWAPAHMPGGVDPLIEELKDQEALIIDFLGFAFWLSTGLMQPLDHWDPSGRMLNKSYLDAWPFAQLKGWHEQVECWGAVDYLRGLKNENDIRMAAGGFKAGVIGEMPAGSLDGIVEPEPNL